MMPATTTAAAAAAAAAGCQSDSARSSRTPRGLLFSFTATDAQQRLKPRRVKGAAVEQLAASVAPLDEAQQLDSLVQHLPSSATFHPGVVRADQLSESPPRIGLVIALCTRRKCFTLH